MKIQDVGAIGMTAVLWGCFATGTEAGNEKTTIRGWLADEDCAKNRASDGKYTMTSLNCARECIAKGKKIALIDPEKKRVLVVSNQQVVAKNLGDYVEVVGEMDAQGKMLHVDSLKFLEKNRAMCDVPKKTPTPSKQQ